MTWEEVETEQDRRAFIEYYEGAHEATPTPDVIDAHMRRDEDGRRKEMQDLWEMRR